jgi:hypothetical protein
LTITGRLVTGISRRQARRFERPGTVACRSEQVDASGRLLLGDGIIPTLQP